MGAMPESGLTTDTMPETPCEWTPLKCPRFDHSRSVATLDGGQSIDSSRE